MIINMIVTCKNCKGSSLLWDRSGEEKPLISAVWQPLHYALLLLHVKFSNVHPCPLQYRVFLLHMWLWATFYTCLRCTALSRLCKGHRDMLRGYLQNVCHWGQLKNWSVVHIMSKNLCVQPSSTRLCHFTSHFVYILSNLVNASNCQYCPKPMYISGDDRVGVAV